MIENKIKNSEDIFKKQNKKHNKKKVFLIPQNNLCLNDRLILTFEVTACPNKVILIHVGHHVHDDELQRLLIFVWPLIDFPLDDES